ncbi:MAG: hypothetical protein AAF495_13380 [Pseudomonadota bacterium]
MQIIESSAFAVRSAVIRLEADEGRPSFVLFPMVHVGAPEFYAEVSERLGDCDIILCEGVKTRAVSLLTLSYRFYSENPKLGLVTQNRGMTIAHLKNRLVHADVSGDAFDRRWWDLKTWDRFLLLILAPLYGLYMRYFGTRAQMARALNLNLRKSREEILSSEDNEEIMTLLFHWRDRRLLEIIDQTLDEAHDGNQTIGVLYGARHMRAVIRHLIGRHSYRVAKSEWVTVFPL